MEDRVVDGRTGYFLFYIRWLIIDSVNFFRGI